MFLSSSQQIEFDRIVSLEARIAQLDETNPIRGELDKGTLEVEKKTERDAADVEVMHSLNRLLTENRDGVTEAILAIPNAGLRLSMEAHFDHISAQERVQITAQILAEAEEEPVDHITEITIDEAVAEEDQASVRQG